MFVRLGLLSLCVGAVIHTCVKMDTLVTKLVIAVANPLDPSGGAFDPAATLVWANALSHSSGLFMPMSVLFTYFLSSDSGNRAGAELPLACDFGLSAIAAKSAETAGSFIVFERAAAQGVELDIQLQIVTNWWALERVVTGFHVGGGPASLAAPDVPALRSMVMSWSFSYPGSNFDENDSGSLRVFANNSLELRGLTGDATVRYQVGVFRENVVSIERHNATSWLTRDIDRGSRIALLSGSCNHGTGINPLCGHFFSSSTQIASVSGVANATLRSESADFLSGDSIVSIHLFSCKDSACRVCFASDGLPYNENDTFILKLPTFVQPVPRNASILLSDLMFIVQFDDGANEENCFWVRRPSHAQGVLVGGFQTVRLSPVESAGLSTRMPRMTSARVDGTSFSSESASAQTDSFTNVSSTVPAQMLVTSLQSPAVDVGAIVGGLIGSIGLILLLLAIVFVVSSRCNPIRANPQSSAVASLSKQPTAPQYDCISDVRALGTYGESRFNQLS